MPAKTFETATNTFLAVRIIGNGGTGDVYLVRDVDGQEFALKCLRIADSAKRKRFSNELSFCQQKQHDNIVHVLDSGAVLVGDVWLPFYVMPLYPHTLRRVMRAGMPHERCLRLFDQILSGVEAAHLRKGFHRDLKPENILCNGTGDRLVVADFGIAHFAQDELLTAVETRDQERLANFLYAAPEQRIRGGAVDHGADIFALGLILNEMFTGTVPLAEGHPLIANVAAEYAYLDEVVGWMIRHSPADRPTSIGKVKEEILARGNEFVALQRLDALRNEVVPAFQPNDPLHGVDVRVTDLDYEDGMLKAGLDPTPPPQWWEALRDLGDFSFVGGTRPDNVGFAKGKALLRADPNSADQVAFLFRDWVARTNLAYRQRLQRDAQRSERELRERLATERQAAEERARVLSRLRNISLS